MIELEAMGGAGRDEAARHDAEVRRLRASYEDAAAQAARERGWNEELEEALANAEGERDSYRYDLETTRKELVGRRESVERSNRTIVVFEQARRRVGFLKLRTSWKSG